MKLIFLSLLIPFLLIASTNDRALYVKKYANESKTALVIGNSNYSGKLSKLQNPTNDAKDIKNALEDLNFEVVYTTDADQAKMDQKIREFTHKLESKKGIALFYFAGHGLEVDKKNYLVPLNANVSDKYKVKYQTIAVNEIVDRMQNSGTRLNMLILDACRNDPFHRGGGGLATPQTAKGTLIAYATDPGGVAQDNPNEKNGLYTKYLLKALKAGDLNHADFFRKVKNDVYQASNGEQFPYVNDGTIGEFYFKINSDELKSTNKRKSYPKENSTFSFDNISPSTFSLTIDPTPYDAKVQITNIKSKYHDGIKLKKGNYNIKVSKSGYITKQGNIDLKSDITIPIVLDKEQVVYKETKPQISKIPIDKDTYIQPAMIKIKSGSFMMGSDDGDSDEKPVHKVTIPNDFYIGKYEVTFKEYDKFCEDTGRSKPKDRGWGRGDHPVINVSWNDAKAYAKWLSKKTGKNYRLPTESEWEYVARAGTTTKYSFGNSSSDLNSYAWYDKNSYDKGSSHPDYGTHNVGTKQPNPWGVYDMHGNVWEWCEDWYIDNYNSTPRDGTAYNNKKDYKVLRGGSWDFNAGGLRSAYRVRGTAVGADDGSGFRLVLSD